MSGADGRLFCIGDVHGCVDELGRLIDDIAPEANDRIVFLGDYVDRGPEVAATIGFLLEIRRHLPETVFLRGNHEEMMLGFLGEGGEHGDIFVRGGGAATLESYGVDRHDRGAARTLREKIPAEHLELLRDHLSLWHSISPWVFAHAGVRPGTPMREQEREDLLWIREDFLSREHGLDTTVVFGHTAHRDVVFSPSRRIAMDTGCVYGGMLSALDLSQGVLHQIRRGAGKVGRRDVAEALDRAI
ncbi:MAG: serine/threonine protein phosphatase [Deltaproteobacteria bacterium]|nr:serine/threonine protein phosphatase [Deltaproteobacteria bacterium]